MSRAALLATILSAASLLVAGCDTRGHENPFDPRNPDTRGAPEDLAAVAGDRQVELRFDPLGVTDMRGWRVWRWSGAETTLVGDSLRAPASRVAVDSALTNGTTYWYALDILPPGTAPGVRGRPDLSTPGRVVPWVVDAALAPLAQLGADARRVRARFGDGGPFADLAVSQADGSVWATDEFEARLWHFDSRGVLISRIDDLPAFYRLAWRASDDGLWALSRVEHALYRLDAAGAALDAFSIGGDGDLRDLDADPGDGSAWVTDGAGAIEHFAQGASLASLGLSGTSPFAASLDPLGRGIWVSDPNHGLVSFFRRTLSAWQQVPVAGFDGIPREVAARLGPSNAIQAWTVDLNGGLVLAEANPDSASGRVIARIVSIASPRAAVATPDGACWLIEGDTGMVVRVDPADLSVARFAALEVPRAIGFWWRMP